MTSTMDGSLLLTKRCFIVCGSLAPAIGLICFYRIQIKISRKIASVMQMRLDDARRITLA